MTGRKKPETVGVATEEDYVYLKFKRDFCAKRGKSIQGRKGEVKRVHVFDVDKTWIEDEGPCRVVKRPKEFGVEDHEAAGGETADENGDGDGSGTE